MNRSRNAAGRATARIGATRTDEENADGLTGAEGAFLPCSFWYADNLLAQGRITKAQVWLKRPIGVANNVGLLAKEYDPNARRQLGDFPQAFSHVALVNSVGGLFKPLAAWTS